MTETLNIYLNGFAKPLGEWSERALTQTRADLVSALEHETRPRGREALMFNIAVVEAETRRRAGALTPDEVERMSQRGVLKSMAQKRDEARAANRAAALEAQARAPARQTEPNRAAAQWERDRGGRERD